MTTIYDSRTSGYNRKGAWKVKSLRSTFGNQCLANIPTSPNTSFGSSLRDQAAKTYVSSEVDRALAKSKGGNNSQGPIYRLQDAIGKQQLSTMRSAPNSAFGSAKRPSMAVKTPAPGPGAYQIKSVVGANASSAFDSTKKSMPSVRFPMAIRDVQEKIFISAEHDKSMGGRFSPGPSAYNTGSLLGARPLTSTQHSVPAHKMGTMPRFRTPGDKQAATFPGPGQYGAPATHIESGHTSLPSVGFARANRDAAKKIFISLDHEKASYGEIGPGPGTAIPIRSLGPQLMSKAKSAPTWRFPTSKRAPLASADGPGPGEYYA